QPVYHRLLTAMPDATERDLLRLLDVLEPLGDDAARAVLLHPSATEAVWAEAARGDSHGLHELVWSRKSLLDLPWIRRALMHSPTAFVLEELHPFVEGEELRLWMRRLLEVEDGPRTAANCLEVMQPERLSALRRADLQAMLESPNAQARLAAI